MKKTFTLLLCAVIVFCAMLTACSEKVPELYGKPMLSAFSDDELRQFIADNGIIYPDMDDEDKLLEETRKYIKLFENEDTRKEATDRLFFGLLINDSQVFIYTVCSAADEYYGLEDNVLLSQKDLGFYTELIENYNN